MPVIRVSRALDIETGGSSLIQGAGSNIPDAGSGWTRWFELDVTQNDQSALKGSLSYLATLGFIGTRWTTPDGDGSGCYFDELVDGRRCMEFRWGAGGTSEGRCALHEVSTVTQYDQMYQRAIVRFTPQEHWPSNSIKLLRTLRDGGSNANGFFNAAANSTNPNYPMGWAFTNIATGGGGAEYHSSHSWRPFGEDEWFELEVWTKKNSASSFDGEGQAWVGPVGSATLIDDFDEFAGPTQDTDHPSDMQWSTGGVGHSLYELGPYLGGSPGITLTTDQSILFATHSIWVK